VTPEAVAAELQEFARRVPQWALAGVMVAVRDGGYVVMFRARPSALWVEFAHAPGLDRVMVVAREALVDVMLHMGSGAKCA